MTPWIIGLDVGQLNDPSALCIAQTKREEWGDMRHMTYQVRHLERFPLGMPYPQMVEAVQRRVQALPKPHGWDGVRYVPSQGGLAMVQRPPTVYTLVIDGTGVGRPVVDMFRKDVIFPVVVTLTHGFHVVEHVDRRYEYSVPKPAVIGATQVALQSGRLKVARGLQDAAVLIKEASNFQYRMRQKNGDEQYAAWRENEHDDLLLAMAVMLWYAEYTEPPLTQPMNRQSHATATPAYVRRD